MGFERIGAIVNAHPALFLTAIVLAASLSVGAVNNAESDSQFEADGVQPAEFVLSTMAEGGLLIVEDENGTQTELPLKVRGHYVTETDDGLPDPGSTTLSLFGDSGEAQARLVVRGEIMKLAYNGPGLDTTLDLVVPESARPASSDDSNETTHNEPDSRGETSPEPAGEPHQLGWSPYPLEVSTFPLSSGMHMDENHILPPVSDRPNATGLHVSPPGGDSIAITQHIYTPDTSDAIDPVNVVFYHHGAPWWVKQAMNDGGWDETACGFDKELWFFNQMHGGVDEWRKQDDMWDDVLVPCPGERNHLREYNSPTADTHDPPNFAAYTIGPTHWEDTTHSSDSIDPRRGQDNLFFDISGGDHVPSWSGIIVANSASDCDSCDNWDGLVDFYETVSDGHMGSHSAHCDTTSYDQWTGSGARGTMKVRFHCS